MLETEVTDCKSNQASSKLQRGRRLDMTNCQPSYNKSSAVTEMGDCSVGHNRRVEKWKASIAYIYICAAFRGEAGPHLTQQSREWVTQSDP